MPKMAAVHVVNKYKTITPPPPPWLIPHSYWSLVRVPSHNVLRLWQEVIYKPDGMDDLPAAKSMA